MRSSSAEETRAVFAAAIENLRRGRRDRIQLKVDEPWHDPGGMLTGTVDIRTIAANGKLKAWIGEKERKDLSLKCERLSLLGCDRWTSTFSIDLPSDLEPGSHPLFVAMVDHRAGRSNTSTSRNIRIRRG